ncbi:hypothetical protein [Phytohabitans rumicis]|uniref:Uncharacterized protein n=1 Tax=Phytohabitans rumicis TaxID=1076125 RepID=A0A6V8LIM8_9ACTN|nr:hypothetical protein [Phytohabitans rumicis]GFJ95410.1 hypothetical protein Prum_090520 [Phytohabitans rumicis]
MDEQHAEWVNGPTLDLSDRPVGRVPRQYVPPDASTPVPRMMRARPLSDMARTRVIPADRLVRGSRNRGQG